MNFFDRLMRLDRRWIFLFLVIVCVITYAFEFEVPILVEREVERIYEFVDSLPPGDIVMIAIDYDPNNMAELHPMAYAIIEQCWRKELKVLVTSLSQNGPGMADEALRKISDSLRVPKTYNGVEYPAREIVNGVDFTFLGYKPYFALVILGMGQDFRLPFPSDYYGNPLDSIPSVHARRTLTRLAALPVVTTAAAVALRCSSPSSPGEAPRPHSEGTGGPRHWTRSTPR